MLTVEPGTLLRKLNATCTRAFEAAAAACITARHYEVTVEHVLAALLDDPASDFSLVLQHYNIAPDVIRSTVQRYLGDFRTGNAGRPVFSSLLLEWTQDAWLYCSTELGESQVRSGALLVRLALSASRYLPFELPALEQINREELRKDLMLIAAGSSEAVGGGASAGSGKGGAPAKAGGGSALERFTLDLTERARSGELDPVFGREREIRQVIEILVRRRKNNPIVVGEPGVGKTALVEGLAMRVAQGSVPELLKNVRVLSLDLGALQAGASVRGEFENRLKGVIEEVKGSAQPIVLFIDEAHTLIGAGGPQGGGDAANLLKPALARGELRTVAATTYAEFKKYFEKDAALERRFQPVRVAEPSVETATLMLRGLRASFEKAHGVLISDEAVRAAVTLSSRYISGRQLPDKAVDLLDTSAAYVNLLRNAPPPELEDIRARLEGVERELNALAADEAAGLSIDVDARKAALELKASLSEREQTLTERHAEQRSIVERIDEHRKTREPPEEAAAAREELTLALGQLRQIPADERLVSADVDEAVVAAVVSGWTGVPVGKMVRDDVQGILELEKRLGQRVRGQDAALEVLGRELRAARSGLKPPSTPLGVFLLVGPSGVGKTETALGLSDLMFGGERFMVTINMSEFQERHTVSRLIGSPPGYVGYGEGGVLTEAVRHRPYSVVLLDEIEKADQEVMNLFYQVFDKGMLSDGEGRVIDFKNTVIIMTSNLATDLITDAAAPDKPAPDYADLIDLVKPTLSAYLKPALLARMTVVPYLPIRPEALGEIVRMKLRAVADRAFQAHRIELVAKDEVVDAIVARCTEVESGARNVDHILRGSILPLLSSEILKALAEEAAIQRLCLQLDPSGNITCAREEI